MVKLTMFVKKTYAILQVGRAKLDTLSGPVGAGFIPMLAVVQLVLTLCLLLALALPGNRLEE